MKLKLSAKRQNLAAFALMLTIAFVAGSSSAFAFGGAKPGHSYQDFTKKKYVLKWSFNHSSFSDRSKYPGYNYCLDEMEFVTDTNHPEALRLIETSKNDQVRPHSRWIVPGKTMIASGFQGYPDVKIETKVDLLADFTDLPNNLGSRNSSDEPYTTISEESTYTYMRCIFAGCTEGNVLFTRKNYFVFVPMYRALLVRSYGAHEGLSLDNFCYYQY